MLNHLGDQEGASGAEAGTLPPSQRHCPALGQEGLHRAAGQVQERHKGVHATSQGGENCLQGDGDTLDIFFRLGSVLRSRVVLLRLRRRTFEFRSTPAVKLPVQNLKKTSLASKELKKVKLGKAGSSSASQHCFL